jgi:hypothetical protein
MFYENIDEYNFIKFDEQINHISFMKISYNIVWYSVVMHILP